jgi:hypothetical protein
LNLIGQGVQFENGEATVVVDQQTNFIISLKLDKGSL